MANAMVCIGKYPNTQRENTPALLVFLLKRLSDMIFIRDIEISE